MEDHSNNVVKTEEVIGKSVLNPEREKVGKIEEIVLDKVEGTTKYVVLSFSEFLGLKDKYFALPWKSISYDPTEESFILNVDKQRLKDAPGFDKNNWPDMASPEFASQISNYYSNSGYTS